MGYPPRRGVVTKGRPSAQPASTSAPTEATAPPAIIGTRSKKPINGPWRPGGLSATVFELAMLLRPKTYSRKLTCAILPGDRFSIAEESAGRTVVGQCSEPYHGLGAFGDWARRSAPAHVCLYPSRVDRVHQNPHSFRLCRQ